jgi:hypothetical protein
MFLLENIQKCVLDHDPINHEMCNWYQHHQWYLFWNFFCCNWFGGQNGKKGLIAGFHIIQIY